MTGHRRRSPCCADEARRFLASADVEHEREVVLEPARARIAELEAAAAFMLELVDEYYGTDHEFDIPAEAEFRRHRAAIEAGP